MKLKIRQINLDEIQLAVQVLNHIPEFNVVFYKASFYKLLSKAETILLIAEFAGKPIGCIVAYNRYFDGSIYSWLGGVLPPFRNQGIGLNLLYTLEKGAKRKMFLSIRMETRNKHIVMLCFAIKNGFQISGFLEENDLAESRIELNKKW